MAMFHENVLPFLKKKRNLWHTINQSVNVSEFHYFVMSSVAIYFFVMSTLLKCVILCCRVWFSKFPLNAIPSFGSMCRETVMDILELKDFTYQAENQPIIENRFILLEHCLLFHWGNHQWRNWFVCEFFGGFLSTKHVEKVVLVFWFEGTDIKVCFYIFFKLTNFWSQLRIHLDCKYFNILTYF